MYDTNIATRIPGARAYTDYTNIYLGPQTADSERAFVFKVFKVKRNNKDVYLVQKYGDIDIKGLYAYTYTVGHEQGHNDSKNAGAYDFTVVPNGDADGDGLSDAWELRNNLDTTVPNTTMAYNFPSAFADKGKEDRECLCDINATGYMIGAHSQKLWQQDWVAGGMQWGEINITGKTVGPDGKFALRLMD